MELEKINEFLSSWSKGVIEIGKIHREGGDYRNSAKLFLDTHYAFTKEVVFRNNEKDALSYFVGRDISEDNGFALKPWDSIQLDELNTLIEEDLTAAMGTLKFKPYEIEETTLVAFTFIFRKIDESLKIKVHHSSPVT